MSWDKASLGPRLLLLASWLAHGDHMPVTAVGSMVRTDYPLM